MHVVLGMDPNGRLWLLDLWRGQTAADAWIEAFCDLVRQWRPIGWAEETGQIRAGVGPFLERRMRERQAYVARRPFPTRGDKAVRTQSIRGRMALDGLHLPRAAPWRQAFEAELLTFPAGRHDDQVDALGLVGQLLDRMVKGSALRPKPDEQEDRYTRLFANDDEEGVTSWKTV
ncbi:phage terminase large subunit [Muricoccus aerilatus]|uniref:phage terminase large subunit n=1 Tax=Muricoccus aerilatus TaxID=452982 RepID=UPI00069428F6|nr:phage terminase large subunit [Roseomonas aerilata]